LNLSEGIFLIGGSFSSFSLNFIVQFPEDILKLFSFFSLSPHFILNFSFFLFQRLDFVFQVILSYRAILFLFFNVILQTVHILSVHTSLPFELINDLLSLVVIGLEYFN
jgi:hypothetical protein